MAFTAGLKQLERLLSAQAHGFSVMLAIRNDILNLNKETIKRIVLLFDFKIHGLIKTVLEYNMGVMNTLSFSLYCSQ